MHPEAYDFIQRCRLSLGDISSMRILEFGAHNVNGSPRPLFEGCQSYTGLDPWPGPGVNIMARAQDLFRNDDHWKYDLVISAEVLEHDPDWIGQIDAASRALKPGGKLIITAAAHPRPPHRCDGTPGDLQGEYYGNMIPLLLREILLIDFNILTSEIDRHHGDVHVLAEKRGW